MNGSEPDGLPTPGEGGTISPPAPAPMPQASSGLGAALNRARQKIKKWGQAITTRASTSDQLGFVPFAPSGPTGLENVRSFYAQAIFGSGPIEPSTAALLTGIATAMGHPVQTITDEYQSNKINTLSSNFLTNNGTTLIDMHRHLKDAKRLMLEMSDFKCTFNLAAAYEILDRKQHIGTHEWYTIHTALEGSDLTTDQRKSLEAAKAELEKFFNDVKPQLDQDKKVLDSLKDYFDLVCHRISIFNGAALYKAGNSAGPELDMWTGDKVRETTHTLPDAVLHTISLHDLLLGCMGNLGGALGADSSTSH